MSKLGNVRRGRLGGPLRYLFYGVEGVGKSTLAADAPAPIYLDLEDGTGLLDCARYPFRDGPGGHVAASYRDVVSAVEDLLVNGHEFKTLVIDTIDRLEPLLWAHVCQRDSERWNKTITSIEGYGYGRGYQVALDEWRVLCQKLDELRTRRGMSIVFVGHAQVKTFHNPEGDDYDRYSLRIHEKAAGFLREWCDVLGFCCFEGGAGKLDGDGDRERVKGFSTGRRLIRLERTAAYDAKSRIPLPGAVELMSQAPWSPIAEAAAIVQELGTNITAEDLEKRIDAELARLGDEELAAKVADVRARAAGDVRLLARALIRLQGR